MQLNHSLLTAMLEQWRPKINTFHHSVGEIIFTLQDVAIILRLNVDGPPSWPLAYNSRGLAYNLSEVT